MPNILIAHEDGENLRITGMVDVTDDLQELVGTSTESPEIVLEKSAGANLEQAIVNGLRSARSVLGGYVKFAKPIVLKGVVPPYVTEKLSKLANEAKAAPEASAAPVVPPPAPKRRVKAARRISLDDLASQLAADGVVKGGITEKLAAVGVAKHKKEATTRRKQLDGAGSL